MSPPGNGRGRPRQEAAPKSVTSARTSVTNLAAYRCWSHHWCGCSHVGDCRLNDPLPVHEPQPCPGLYGAGGQWMSCCAPTGTGAA